MAFPVDATYFDQFPLIFDDGLRLRVRVQVKYLRQKTDLSVSPTVHVSSKLARAK